MPETNLTSVAQETDESTDPIEKELGLSSQLAFRHAPFRQTQWEVVGVRVTQREFEPLRCSILGTSSGARGFHPDEFDILAGLAEGTTVSASDSYAEAPSLAKPEQLSSEEIERIAEARFEEGKQFGYAEGYEDGVTTTEEKLVELRSHIGESFRSLEIKADEYFQRMEKNAVELALKIAHKILVTTVEVKPDYILEVIREGLKSIGAAKPLRIRVSVADFEFLEVIGVPPELSTQELGVQYVFDESVKSGCVIETDFGEVDLQLDRMWEQIAANLYEVYKP